MHFAKNTSNGKHLYLLWTRHALIVGGFSSSFVCGFLHDKTINSTPATTNHNDLVRATRPINDDASIDLEHATSSISCDFYNDAMVYLQQKLKPSLIGLPSSCSSTGHNMLPTDSTFHA